MIIKSVKVGNFRSILDETLDCESLTALVGPNGSGKSSFLRALELFYAGSPKLDIQDFYAEDTSREIEIAVTFTELGEEERARFESYLEGDDLAVVRVLSILEGKIAQKYHGSRLLNPEFLPVRNAPKAPEAKAAYEQLRKGQKYEGLPKWTSKEQAIHALNHWEQEHPGQCLRQRDEGQFFGFTEVAQGYLGRYTKFIPIPAVRDAASDAEEGRGSAVKEIIDLVVRSSLVAHKDLVELRDQVKKRYDEIVDPANLGELQTLQARLTKTLRTYVADASVRLAWMDAGELQFPLPRTDVRLTEDGYSSSVGRTGHGLQRAFILTMLQHLAVARTPVQQTLQTPEPLTHSNATEPSRPGQEFPDLILGIEEPELYQHPNRQRHLATVLLRLASGDIPGVARRTQIIYSTHSPAFVGLDRFNQVRLFRKVANPDGGPKVTKVVRASLDRVAEALWELHGKPTSKYTGESLLPRLHTLMTPWMNEGFFAEVIVLVEGEEDRAAVVGVALSQRIDLESLGVSVIPCMGKNNLDRAALIFKAFGIPVYLVWDSDKDDESAKAEVNRCLLRLVGQAEEDFPECVGKEHARFKTNLGETLRREIGAEFYDQVLADLQQDLGIAKQKDILKNAIAIRALIERAHSEARTSATLESIIEGILGLRQNSPGVIG
jgi:hypothetical protein